MDFLNDDVLKLKEICQNFLLKNLQKFHHILGPFIQQPPTTVSRDVLLTCLPTDLPPSASFQLIQDQDYWKRTCLQRWPTGLDVWDYGRDWQRVLAQKVVQEFAENFTASPIKQQELEDLASWAEPWITNLDIQQVLNEPHNGNHGISRCYSNIGEVLTCFQCVQKLALNYGVRYCGMDFIWTPSPFSIEDCARLAEALPLLRNLRMLNLSNNSICDVHVLQLVTSMKRMHLSELSLPHNRIGDKGVRALCDILHEESTLESLDLCNNEVGNEGAICVAHKLNSCKLKRLILRLNLIENEGAEMLFKTIASNETLGILNVSGNLMTREVLPSLHSMLLKNSTLQHLDISLNVIGEDDQGLIEKAVDQNKKLVEFNIQLCHLSISTARKIAAKVRSNAKFNDLIEMNF